MNDIKRLPIDIQWQHRMNQLIQYYSFDMIQAVLYSDDFEVYKDIANEPDNKFKLSSNPKNSEVLRLHLSNLYNTWPEKFLVNAIRYFDFKIVISPVKRVK